MKKYIYLLLIPLIILSCNKRRSETLKEAIYTGNLDDVKYFIENGADINALFSNGFSPLYIAVQLEHNDVVQYLLDNGAIINKVYKDDEYGGYSVMLVSSLTPEILQMLIDHGANVNLSGKNKASSPLHFWVHRGRYDIVKLLLKHGADVKAKNL